QILHTSGDAEAAIAAVEGARAIAKRQVEVDPEDAVMARHVVVFDDQLGVAWQTIGEDATRSNTERRAAYDAAIAAFKRSREGLSMLLVRQRALPGGEGVLHVHVDLIVRCEAARAALLDG